jgi:hypothetical protein
MRDLPLMSRCRGRSSLDQWLEQPGSGTCLTRPCAGLDEYEAAFCWQDINLDAIIKSRDDAPIHGDPRPRQAVSLVPETPVPSPVHSTRAEVMISNRKVGT